MIYIAIILICAELWRRGGDGQSLFRNPLVPIILSLGKFYLTGYNWWVLLYIPLMWGAIQAFSYGLSSPIHKLVVWIFKRGEDGNNQVVEIVTRAICGLLWSLPASVFALFEGSWVKFAIYAVLLTILNGLIGGLVKNLELSERGVGASVALGVLI